MMLVLLMSWLFLVLLPLHLARSVVLLPLRLSLTFWMTMSCLLEGVPVVEADLPLLL